MRLDSRQIIEIVSVAAIVISLAFVGMQLMLDRNVAIAAQYAARSESLKADIRARMESDGLMASRIKSWESGNRPSYWSDELEEYYGGRNVGSTDIPYLLLQLDIRLIHMDNLYYQYTKDLLDESFWIRQIAAIKNDLRNPLFKVMYLDRPRGLEQLVDELILELEEE